MIIMKERQPVICVLMSSYNGEKYIKQQIDSILSQEDVELKLVIRDDGSTDGTRDIIREYSSVLLIAGENIGCELSFMELLHFKIEADYYAFSDQDDVWHPRKLISAIENIQQHHCDLSVCNLMMVDSNLMKINPLFSKADIDYNQFLMDRYAQSNLQGCVQVWTRKLHDMIQSYRPKKVVPHDTWVNAIANIVSSTFVDENCYIDYRLHEDNVSGYTTSILKKIPKRLKLYFWKKHPLRDDFWKEILESGILHLGAQDVRYKTICLIAYYKKGLVNKLRLCFSSFFREMPLQYRLLWSLCVILNKY